MFVEGIGYFRSLFPESVRNLLGFITGPIGVIFVLMVLPGGLAQGLYILRDNLRILSVAPLAHDWVDAIPDVGHRGQIDIKTEDLQSPRHRRHLRLNRGWPLLAGLSGAGQTGDASLEKTD